MQSRVNDGCRWQKIVGVIEVLASDNQVGSLSINQLWSGGGGGGLYIDIATFNTQVPGCCTGLNVSMTEKQRACEAHQHGQISHLQL